MNIAVRYYTKTGNTEKLAVAIAEALGTEARPVSAPLEEKVDILFLGSSVYAAGVDGAVKTFIADNAKNIGTVVNFSTAALLSSTYKQVKRICADNGVAIADDEFHCRGSFKFIHRSRPNGEDLEAAKRFATDVVNKF